MYISPWTWALNMVIIDSECSYLATDLSAPCKVFFSLLRILHEVGFEDSLAEYIGSDYLWFWNELMHELDEKLILAVIDKRFKLVNCCIYLFEAFSYLLWSGGILCRGTGVIVMLWFIVHGVSTDIVLDIVLVHLKY